VPFFTDSLRAALTARGTAGVYGELITLSVVASISLEEDPGAWLIALTTGLFGESEFAIRLSAPLLHAGTAVLVYAIGARLYDSRVGLWSALAYASLPGASVSAFIISTDAPLVLFWAAALYAFIRARDDGGAGWWVALGLACGLGLLAKYAMAYWLLSALGYVLLVRAEHRHLRPLLAAADVAVNPVARGSGQSLKVVEYLAAGLPVVALPAGGGSTVAQGDCCPHRKRAPAAIFERRS